MYPDSSVLTSTVALMDAGPFTPTDTTTPIASVHILPPAFPPCPTNSGLEHFYHPKLQEGCSLLPFCQRLLEPPSPGLRFPWRSPYSPKRALLHRKGPPVCLLFFLLIYLRKLRAEMLSHWSPPLFSAVCFLLGVSPWHTNKDMKHDVEDICPVLPCIDSGEAPRVTTFFFFFFFFPLFTGLYCRMYRASCCSPPRPAAPCSR